MSAPTHQDATVLLKLYEFGGDPHLQEAWKFIFSDDFIDDYQAFISKYPATSDQHDYFFHYSAWFELLGTLWKHKLISEALLFDWILVPPRWQRVEKLIAGYREESGEPRMYENFEAMAKAAE
jgi:hypothetical protein